MEGEWEWEWEDEDKDEVGRGCIIIISGRETTRTRRCPSSMPRPRRTNPSPPFRLTRASKARATQASADVKAAPFLPSPGYHLSSPDSDTDHVFHNCFFERKEETSQRPTPTHLCPRRIAAATTRIARMAGLKTIIVLSFVRLPIADQALDLLLTKSE